MRYTARQSRPARRLRARAAGRRQRGLSALGMLFVLVVVVLAGMLTLKLVPHYMDFYTIQSILQGLPASEVKSATRTSLSDSLKKRFKINNLRDFEIRDIITLERSREATVLLLAYERREHLFFNVDVVLNFEKRIEYSS